MQHQTGQPADGHGGGPVRQSHHRGDLPRRGLDGQEGNPREDDPLRPMGERLVRLGTCRRKRQSRSPIRQSLRERTVTENDVGAGDPGSGKGAK